MPLSNFSSYINCRKRVLKGAFKPYFITLRVKNPVWSESEYQGVKKEAHSMPVIYLDKHRHLTEKQKKMAEVALSNEINDVMANLEILEEEMDRTSVFGELNLREIALKYLGQKVKRNPDGSVDEKVLQHVYRWYFREE